jgi:hypothetical protein
VSRAPAQERPGKMAGTAPSSGQGRQGQSAVRYTMAEGGTVDQSVPICRLLPSELGASQLSPTGQRTH